ncbi:Sorting nexin-1 [Bienertia sinuspersici]
MASYTLVLSVSQQTLTQLRSSQTTSTSSSKLAGLEDLYKCIEEFIQLPQNQKAHSEQLVEEVLDGSLRLFDICSTSQDVLVQSKKQLQNIQSTLQRRCSGELNMNNEFAQYLKNRKVAKKSINKCLTDIKEVEKTNESNGVESKLKDVQAMTADVFKSLLNNISGSQKSSWSFSKLVGQKAEKQTFAPISKFDAVDATLELICQKKKFNVDMSQIVQLESEIQQFDEVLQCLLRHLVKTKGTLLNHTRSSSYPSIAHPIVEQIDQNLGRLRSSESLYFIIAKQNTYKPKGFNMRIELMTLESEIQTLDEALDTFFRHLVKTRATLLNILSN